MPFVFWLWLAFQGHPLSAEWKARMVGVTWHAGCPVALEELRVLEIPYWDFMGKTQRGELVVNRAVAAEAIEIFQDLYDSKFPIERMRPIEEYGGNDERSMEANNTSAFNCRDVTGQPGKFSNHSWGLAIDINPLTNPYVKGEKVLPAGGRAYLDRSEHHQGGIYPDDFIVRLFTTRGWAWGGAWFDRKDYQHFEKPAK